MMAASVICLLCLNENATTAAEYIDIHSERGVQMQIAPIIKKHFSVSVTETHDMDKICCQCWKIVLDFHTLYEFVSAAQNSLLETKVLPIEDDPLTQSNTNLDKTEATTNDRNFFYPEVKIEEHELDQLPKIEVLENTANLQPVANEPAPTRRLRKRVKLESQTDEESSAFVSDLPLPAKRRGRPRKSENAVENVDDVLNDKSQDSSVKSEGDSETSNEEDEDVGQAGDSSDGDSLSQDSGEDSDFEVEKPTTADFAIIPKRTVVRPKKYKKRTKPTEPRVRMSRELLEQRKAQQKEYDDTIAKFFDNVLPCAVCNLLVRNFTEMQRHHRLTHQIDPGYMMCCGKKFTQRKVLAEHVLVHANPDHFKCQTCGKSFQNSRHLESHQQVHIDPNVKLTFQCDQCPKIFLSKTAIDYHQLNKHVPKSEFKFSCTQCSKRFLTERKLKNHMTSMHDPESTIICDKCGKQMRTKIILKKHQELMHSDKPRPEPELKQCQICAAWLKGMTGLKQHMKSIHVESAGEHRCHVCAKVSPNARALRRHIYHNHECERKFKCTMCEKAFKRPQELREHTSTHTGEVLYTCPNCPMTFFCSANMYKHRQRLHRAQYEADKNQPKPPNILQQAVCATEAMKIKLKQNSNTPPLQGIMEADLKHF